MRKDLNNQEKLKRHSGFCSKHNYIQYCVMMRKSKCAL